MRFNISLVDIFIRPVRDYIILLTLLKRLYHNCKYCLFKKNTLKIFLHMLRYVPIWGFEVVGIALTEK
jgi:hypothetical protein